MFIFTFSNRDICNFKTFKEREVGRITHCCMCHSLYADVQSFQSEQILLHMPQWTVNREG